MKTLLFLNGSYGSQTGIEDGFNYLLKSKKISNLEWFYFEDYAKKNNSKKTTENMMALAKSYKPNLIVFFHIGKFYIDKSFVFELKNIESKPILAYDEGDMYGGWSKPITSAMKTLIKLVDAVSIRGLGKFYDSIYKQNKNIIFTPNSNWLFRWTKDIVINSRKNNKIIFIGNKIKSRLGNNFRLPGANEREKLVLSVSEIFKDDFIIYGNGWQDISSNQGMLNFDEQPNVCNQYWIQLTFEHYPDIPFFFSDRIPIALSSGQIVVTNYKSGYLDIFNKTDFIYFYKTNKEAIEILYYLRSLSEKQLLKKSIEAKKWADKNLSPEVVWTNFFNKIIKNK